MKLQDKVAVPFPTAMIGDFPREAFAVMSYGAVMTLAGLSFCLMRYYTFFGADLAFSISWNASWWRVNLNTSRRRSWQVRPTDTDTFGGMPISKCTWSRLIAPRRSSSPDSERSPARALWPAALVHQLAVV
jgi:hypothetical protein